MIFRTILCVALFLTAIPIFAEPRVTLELLTEQGFSITGSQEWAAAMNRVGADSVRIRQAQSGDEGEIKNLGTDAAPSYVVRGLLGANGRLRLPGVSNGFSINQASQIAAYIDKLKDVGLEGLASPPAAFGLTGTQLVTLHETLGLPVTVDTKGQRAGDLMRKIVAGVPLNVTVDEAARPAFAANTTVSEELNGVSVGTAMAAILRPLGLVLVPHRPRGGEVQLYILDARKATESWPVGWPPEESPAKAFPKLYEFLNVEVKDFTLTEALDAIQPRLEAPFLFDHNSLARHGVDPGTVQVALPQTRTYYKKIIDRLLAQAQLKSELRVDEAGKPFIWITTVKR